MKCIISGFEPIWGLKRTPSGDLAKLWDSQQIQVPGVEVRALVLPQLFRKSTEILISEIKSFKPDAVIMYGATKKNNPIRFERFAINSELSPMGDNSKIPVEERSVVEGGPAAYTSTLPIDYLIDSLSVNNIHAKSSQFAGTHVCNSIMYGVLHYLNSVKNPSIAGFIHLSFPNEYGVSESPMWSTSNFAQLTKASTATVDALKSWLELKKNPLGK
jgi:pyroglutamyl-peptidase